MKTIQDIKDLLKESESTGLNTYLMSTPERKALGKNHNIRIVWVGMRGKGLFVNTLSGKYYDILESDRIENH